MRARVRWGNVGRAAAVLAVLALAVAWPRLAPPAPQLPADEARPLAVPEVAPEADRPRAKARPEGSRRAKRRRPAKVRRRTERKRPAERRRPEQRSAARPQATVRPPQPPPPTPQPVPRFTPQDPATTEFSFESG